MDIDTPSNSSLKRSNSAPVINDLNPNAVMNNTQVNILNSRYLFLIIMYLFLAKDTFS